MKRQLLGLLGWLLLLPIVGSGRLAWSLLRLLVGLRPKTALTLVGLGVVLSYSNPLTVQLAQAGLWPPEPEILVRVSWVLGLGVLYHGLRSSSLGRLRRHLLQRR